MYCSESITTTINNNLIFELEIYRRYKQATKKQQDERNKLIEQHYESELSKLTNSLNEWKKNNPEKCSEEDLKEVEMQTRRALQTKFEKEYHSIIKKWRLKYEPIDINDNKILKIVMRYFKKDGSIKREFDIEKGLEFIRHQDGKQQKCKVEGFYHLGFMKNPKVKIRLRKNNRIARSTPTQLRPV